MTKYICDMAFKGFNDCTYCEHSKKHEWIAHCCSEKMCPSFNVICDCVKVNEKHVWAVETKINNCWKILFTENTRESARYRKNKNHRIKKYKLVEA